jgi:multiple sugar transport system ATP-binding protein
VTTVYVTHDQVEAMTLGQRVAVMRDGNILQVDAPQTLYREPRDVFVAGFIGSPAMNLVEAELQDGEVVLGDLRVPLDSHRRPPQESGTVVLGIRPEGFEDASFAPAELPTVEVEVAVLEELGSDAHVFFQVDAERVSPERLEDGAAGETGSEEDDALVADSGTLFTARVDPRTRARVGERLALAVDPVRFHFFDPVTGASLLDVDPRAAGAVPVAS